MDAVVSGADTIAVEGRDNDVGIDPKRLASVLLIPQRLILLCKRILGMI